MFKSPYFARFLSGLLFLAAGLVLLYYIFGKEIPPGYMGVRQITMGPGQGFSERALSPGLHIFWPLITKVHLIPETVQRINFHRGQSEEELSLLQIRTNDGVAIDVDVTVLVRFYREAGADHGGPADLVKKLGIEPSAWEQQIRRIASNEIKRSLSAFDASEMYSDPHGRQRKIESAADEMRKQMAGYGIKVESVLLRRYTFGGSQFEETIFMKNLEDIQKDLRLIEGKLAEVKAKVQDREAFWDQEVETLKVRGDNEARVVRSKAALFESEKRAEGDLLVAKGQAEVDRLRASALAQAAGADIFVARELAPLLSSLKGGIVSNIDPYNIDQWVDRLGVSGTAQNTRARYQPKAGIQAGKEAAE